MANKSSYLKYLPPVIWEGEPPYPEFSLGSSLRIFEKLLTGIDGTGVIQHGDHTHESLQHTISNLHKLFDPWTTPDPDDFLDWLASWVSLRFPRVGDEYQWDEYERRKITSEIVQVYRRRGLKRGIEQYLDIYTVAEKRPRIAVDDCAKLLFAQPRDERFVPVDTLLSHGPSVRDGTLVHEGLIAPLCMTLAPDHSLFIGDSGTPSGWTYVVDDGIWRVAGIGQGVVTGESLEPKRIQPAGLNLTHPVALVTDNSSPWHLYILDRGFTALYSLASTNLNQKTDVANRTQLGLNWPVDMVLDNNGHLLILDRGSPPGNPSSPYIVDVQPVPLTVSPPRYLNSVIEPLCFMLQSTGDLIIGDARQQNAAVPADLVRVDRGDPANWVESRMLATLTREQNPLVMPTAIVEATADGVFVLDVGLKPYKPDLASPYLKEIADPAAIYRVDLSDQPRAGDTTGPSNGHSHTLQAGGLTTTNTGHHHGWDTNGVTTGTSDAHSHPLTPRPQVTRATEFNSLVHPMDMVYSGSELLVCDRGEYADPFLSGPIENVWRAKHHEFGVMVHFSEERSTTMRERKKIVADIQQIIEQESPVHTMYTMVYSV